MNGNPEATCKDLIEKLIIPAFCTKDGTVLFANSLSLKYFPSILPGTSARDHFPETALLDDLCHLSFEADTPHGTTHVSISPLEELRFWQLTVPADSGELPRSAVDFSRTELNLLLGRIGLLSRRCPDQEQLCGEMYRNCCRLLKASLLASKPPVEFPLSPYDLSQEVSEFIGESLPYCAGLDLELLAGSLPKFIFISSEKLALSGTLSGLLALCAHRTAPGGQITVNTSRKGERAILSFEISGEPSTRDDPHITADRKLTEDLITKNLRLIGGTLFTLTEESCPGFLVSLPIAGEDVLLCEPPPVPSVGIPYQLIHLSALLPGNYYSIL